MSLILCLEDSAGQDTELEVDEGDDFATFLQKAKDILGYEVDLASITGDKEVNLTDNIYQFLVANEVEGEESEEETVPELPKPKEDIFSSLKQPESSKDSEERIDLEDAVKEFDTLEEKLKQLEDDVKSTNFETKTGKTQNEIKTEVPGEIKEELEEVEDVEYLMEDTEEEELLNTVEGTLKPADDPDEFAEIEYLEDEDNDAQGDEDVMNVEMLDSEMEDDIMEEMGMNVMIKELKDTAQQRNKDKKVSFSEMVGLNKSMETDKSLMSSLNDDEILTVKTEGKQYTRKQLLDILEDSAHEDSEGEDTDLATKQKLANRGKRKADSYDKKMMKDLFYSTPIQPNNKMRRVSFEMDSIKARDISKMSRAEVEYLKSTVRQPIIEVINMTLMDINLCMGSIDEIKKFTDRDREFISSCKNKLQISSDDWKYLPSNYEDVDNDGIYDYLDRDETNFDPNDDGLLAVINEKPPSKKILKQNKEDVASAVGGIHRMFGAVTPVPRKRGRPRKYETTASVPKPKKSQPEPINDYDLFEDIKKESPDSDDDDYVPGKHVDWTKNRQKGKSIGFVCRMCGAYMSKLGQVNSHALSHRLPGRAVFPCILCPYGYTTYSELCKHVREEHDPKKMAVPKKSFTSQGKVMPGTLLTPKNKRGRPPKKLSEEKQREQDDALVGRIISNYTEASLKPLKGNYVTKKYHPNNSNALLGKVIQPQFKIQPNFGNNDDSEDVEDVDMLEEWLDDEEELYIMEMTQNANAALKEEIEAENSSDRSRMMSADAGQARRRLMGKRGEENVFKVEGDIVDGADDILQRIRAELLMDKNDFEIKQLNVSKVVGEDYGKSIENDRLAFMSSIKSVKSKVNTKSNDGIGMIIDQTILKIEPSKSLLKIASDVKDIKSEFTIQYITETEDVKETKVGKSIMDIACEGISELVDPSFSAENIIDMPALDIDIDDTKINIKMIKREDFNLDDAVMESKQYDPSILSIDDNPQEFGQEENSVADLSLCVADEIENVNDLDAHMELGEIPIDIVEAGEICGQNHDELDKLVNVEAEKIAQVHCVISDMPKLDDSEGILDVEDDYQGSSEPVDLNSTIQTLDAENCDVSHFKRNDTECQENLKDICHESAKIENDIEDDEALFDNDCKLKPDDIDDASMINRDLDDSQNIDQIADKQPLEVENNLDEEIKSDLVNVVANTFVIAEDNSDPIDTADESAKEAIVDCSEICYKSEDVDTILNDNDMVIEDVSNGHVQREIEEQEVNEDAKNVLVAVDAAILSMEDDDNKIEYNDFAEGPRDIENQEEITDEKLTEDISIDGDVDLCKVSSNSCLNIDSENVVGEDCLNNEDLAEPKNDDVIDVDENSHQLEDEMSILHGDPILVEDPETINSGDETNKEFEIAEDLDSSVPDVIPESREILSAKEDLPTSKLGDVDLSSDDEVVMMNYDDSLKDNNDSAEIPEKAGDKSLEESPSKPDRGEVSSDDDVVMMDYDDFSSEAGLEISDKTKIENSTYEVVKTHENESHFRDLSPKSNLHDSEDEDVSIGLESQVIEQSPTKLNDSNISIDDEEDRIDYEDFSSEPNLEGCVSEAKNECDATDKPNDSVVLIESDESIDLSETDLSDQNVRRRSS